MNPASVDPAPVTIRTLSEAASKRLLGPFGVLFADEREVREPDEAVAAAERMGHPVVAKLCGETIAHKTERGLVRLGLEEPDDVRRAASELLAEAGPDDGEVSVLVAPMLRGTRELIAGLNRDPVFGMTVVLGLGGVLAEAVADVAIRLVPITDVDATEMIDDLRTQALLGPFRGEPPVDREAVVSTLVGLSEAAGAHPEIESADLNPLIVVEGRPVAVDALVEIRDGGPASGEGAGGGHT